MIMHYGRRDGSIISRYHLHSRIHMDIRRDGSIISRYSLHSSIYRDIIIINEGELLRNRTCTNRLVVISASVYILHVVWALLVTDGIIMMHAFIIITG